MCSTATKMMRTGVDACAAGPVHLSTTRYTCLCLLCPAAAADINSMVKAMTEQIHSHTNLAFSAVCRRRRLYRKHTGGSSKQSDTSFEICQQKSQGTDGTRWHANLLLMLQGLFQVGFFGISSCLLLCHLTCSCLLSFPLFPLNPLCCLPFVSVSLQIRCSTSDSRTVLYFHMFASVKFMVEQALCAQLYNMSSLQLWLLHI